MEVLRVGSAGPNVERWELFLRGMGLLTAPPDTSFGEDTAKATRTFQQREGLGVDGVVGPRTLGRALEKGLDLGFTDTAADAGGLGWPPPPAFGPLVSNEERAEVFGRFSFVSAPQPRNREAIRVTDDWAKKNLATVEVPQLRGGKIMGAPSSGRATVHVRIRDQFLALWVAWERDGLLGLVKTWDGSYAPRFIRGSLTKLSNHAFASAFDINAKFNPLGAVPPLRGERGSVRELVPLANQHGFFWGGHFKSRADGMHFEVARIL